MTMESPLLGGISLRNSNQNKNDLDNLIERNLPHWNATWNMILQANQESSRGKKRPNPRMPVELHKKIRRKIKELVDKEEELVDLYMKAAEAAKDREINLRNKSAILREQIKRDKNIMKILKFGN